MSEGSAEDVDDFGLVMAVMYLGREKVDEWVGRPKGKSGGLVGEADIHGSLVDVIRGVL